MTQLVEAGADLGLRRQLVSRLRPAALLIGVVISLGFPATFFLIERAALHDAATRHARELARQVRWLELQAPGPWKYQAEKYLRILDAFVADKPIEVVEVDDERGQPVAGLAFRSPRAGQPWSRLRPAASAPMTFDNRQRGSITVHVGATQLVWHTALALLVADAVGVGLAVFVYTFPVRVVARMEARLRELSETRERLHGEAQERLVRARQLAELSYTGMERRLRQAQGLVEIATALTSTLELKPLLKIVCQKTAQVAGVTRCSITLRRGEQMVPVMSQFADGHVDLDLWRKFKGDDRPAVEAIPAHAEVIRTGRPVAIRDTAESDLVPAEWCRTFDLRALLFLPLLSGDRVIGTMSLAESSGPRRWAPDEIDLATTIAQQISVVVENARLYQESLEQRRRLSTLVEMTRRLTHGLDLPTVLGSIAEAAATLFGGEAGFRLLEGESLVRIGATEGALRAMVRERIRLGESLSGRVALSGQPIISDDITIDARVLTDHPDSARGARDQPHRTGALMCLPIRLGDRTLGTLHIYRERGYRFDEDALRFATSFADQAAIAIENARLHAAAVRRADQLAALLRASRNVMADLDLDVALQRVIREAGAIAGTPHVKILTVDTSAGVLRCPAWMGAPMPPDFEVPIGAGYSGRVVDTGEPIFVGDTQSDPSNLLLGRDRELGIRTYLGLPVKAADEVLGILTFNTEEPREYTAEELAYLGAFADQAAVAIQHARLYSALEKRLTRLRTLTQLNRLISSSLDRSEVLRAINRAAAELMEAPIAAFWLADATGEHVEVVAFSDPAVGADFPAKRLRFGEGAVGWVAVRRRSLNVPDVFADGRVVGLDWWRTHGLSSFFAVPVAVDDRLVGVLALNARNPFRLDADDEDLLQSFVAQIAVAIRNADLFTGSESRRRAAEALAEVGRALSQTRDPQAVAQCVVNAVAVLLRVGASALYAVAPGSNDLVATAVAGSARAALSGWSFPCGTGAAGLAVAGRQPVTTPNVLGDPRITLLPPERRRIERAGYRAALAVPLVVQERVIGALGVGDVAGRVFDDEDVRLAQAFADQAALALECARLYQEAEVALTGLRAKNAALDSFVYSVSHDLKSPLVAMQGMAGALLEDCAERLDDRGRHYLSRLQANVEQMERLIQDLLTLSRVGREGGGAGPVDLSEVVDDALAELAEPIRTRAIKVTVGELPELRGLRVQLDQVMRNLLGNAVKFMGDAATPAIEVGATRRPDAWECWVRDNGIGIEPAYHEKVFEIFQRLREVDVEGTGVGLALVKKIVDGAGGRVWVESAKGCGATFRFTWPAAPEGRGVLRAGEVVCPPSA
ncbi:MAG: GAF domain-containing protein [Candidatus Rokubacteria bacterium]|nr:GAF domain-containing protein [Candidatus Rokubacteria bacterium]